MRVPEVPIGDTMIRLGQFLKLAGIADNGGEARAMIEAGEVAVNGRVEQQRGRQLRHGDVVAHGERRARLIAGGPAVPANSA